MFLDLHTRCQASLIVVRHHRNARLDHRRTRVELLGHEVHGRAVLGLACLENAPMRVQAWVLGQQRRVDVQYAAGVFRYELRGEYAHEAGEHDQPRRAAANGRGQFMLERGARAARDAGHCLGGNPKIARRLEPGGGGFVRKYLDDAIGGGGAALLDERTHVAAASRYEDDDRLPRQIAAQAMTTPRVPARTSPITSASCPMSRRMAMARSALLGRR